jgi:integrase
MPTKHNASGLPENSGFWRKKDGGSIYFKYEGHAYCTGAALYKDAKTFREKKIAELLNERAVQKARGVRVSDLFNDYVSYLVRKEESNEYARDVYCRNSAKVRSTINKHLLPHFGNLKPEEVTTDLLNRHRDQRVAGGAAIVSVNRELVYFRCAMKLGAEAVPCKVPGRIPKFPIDAKAEKLAVKKGTITDEHYRLILAELPMYMKAIWVTAIHTGFRSKEIRWIRKDQVDLEKGVIRLEMGHTKNGEPREMPIDGEAKQILIEWKRWTNEHYPDVEFFFHRDGKKIDTWMNSWYGTLEKLGLKGKVRFHDTRRTVVTKLESDPLLKSENIRKGTGHSPAMSRRYDQSSATEEIRRSLYTGTEATAPAAPVSDWRVELRELKALLDERILTSEEFENEKQRVLANR